MKNFTQSILALALMLMGAVSMNAAKLNATFGTPANQGAWDAETNTYSWTQSYSNLMQIFTLNNGELANYESLHLTTADYTDAYRVCFMKGGDVLATIKFYSAGEKKLVFAEREETKEIDLTEVDNIKFGGASASGSIVLTDVYLENSLAEEEPVGVETEAKDLTTDMYFTWDGFDASATATGSADCVLVLNEEVAAGGVVFGNPNGSVANSEYADLTGYTKLVVEGVAGSALRILMNRQADNSLIEKQITISETGTAELSFADMEYVHLNCIKTTWGDPATITKLQVVREKQDEPVEVDPRYTDLLQSMYHEWDGVDADAQVVNASPYCEYNVGTAVNAGGTVYGNGSVAAKSYADLTGYDKLIVKGTGGKVRLLFNRTTDNSSDYIEIQEEFDADGQVVVDLTAYEYAHLNVIKFGWGGGGTVESLKLFKDGDDTVGISSIDHSSLNIDHYFDLQGRAIKNGQRSMDNGQLRKGLYIINGKKMLVK